MPLQQWPLYPVALSGSTYFVLNEGYMLAGVAERMHDYLRYCRANGRFRKQRVPVPTQEGTLADAEALRRSPAWRAIRWSGSGPGFRYELSEAHAWRFIRSQAATAPK